MKKYIKLQPATKDFLLKISILKTMMYCGVLWGLYNAEHQGWAIKSENSDHIFPFWMNSTQAIHYAKVHWPNYTPRRITIKDFKESLLPTLTRLDVSPALFNHKNRKFKLSTKQMHQIFFVHSATLINLKS